MNYSIGIKWYLTTFHRNGLTSNKQMINATNKSKAFCNELSELYNPSSVIIRTLFYKIHKLILLI